MSTRPRRQCRMSPLRSRTSLRPLIFWSRRLSDLDDAVGHRLHELGGVAGHEHGEPLGLLTLEPLGQPVEPGGVEPLLGLVEDQQAAGPDERAGEGEAALLARGEGAGQLARLGPQAELARGCRRRRVSASGTPWALAKRSRCSTTLRSGKKSMSSITTARAERTWGERSSISSPSSSIVPDVGLSAPVMHRSTVDLPAPLRPTSATAVPAATSRSSPLTTSTSPNRRTRSRTRSRGGGSGAFLGFLFFGGTPDRVAPPAGACNAGFTLAECSPGEHSAARTPRYKRRRGPTSSPPPL